MSAIWHPPLDEIHASDIPVIQVFNKIDLTGEEPRSRENGENRKDRVWLSAETGDGLELLTDALSQFLSTGFRYHCLNLRPEAGELRSKLFQRCEVIDERVDEKGRITMKLKMEPATMGWLHAQKNFVGLWDEIEAD